MVKNTLKLVVILLLLSHSPETLSRGSYLDLGPGLGNKSGWSDQISTYAAKVRRLAPLNNGNLVKPDDFSDGLGCLQLLGAQA